MWSDQLHHACKLIQTKNAKYSSTATSGSKCPFCIPFLPPKNTYILRHLRMLFGYADSWYILQIFVRWMIRCYFFPNSAVCSQIVFRVAVSLISVSSRSLCLHHHQEDLALLFCQPSCPAYPFLAHLESSSVLSLVPHQAVLGFSKPHSYNRQGIFSRRWNSSTSPKMIWSIIQERRGFGSFGEEWGSASGFLS